MIRAELIPGKKKLPKANSIKNRVIRAIAKLTIRLQTIVKRDKLSGQVLKRKTGTLSRSINIRFAKGGMEGVVGTNVAYGKVWEYGGQAQIRAHMRMMKKAFGKPVANPRMIQVNAYMKDFKERSFLRSALSDLRPEIQPAIQQAIKEGLTS